MAAFCWRRRVASSNALAADRGGSSGRSGGAGVRRVAVHASVLVLFSLAAARADDKGTSPQRPMPSEAVDAAQHHALDGDAGLSALLAGMRSTSGVVADFTETRELALLSSPLEATGTIWFIPPARLVRLVTSPGRSRLVVDGDKVRFESETGTQALDLSASPIARQIVDSFVVLFNGDEKRLRELYDAKFDAEARGAWRLHLSPRSAPLNRMISSFDMHGSDQRIDTMESVEPDGDRTVTRFGRTETAHVFTSDELARLFAPSPAQ